VTGRPSAALLLARALVVGYRDGAVEVRPLDGGAVRALGDSPPGQPVALAPGPAGTLVAVFERGWVVVWDLATGDRLAGAKLAVDALPLILVDGSAVTVMSEHGEVLTLDLSVLSSPACELLRSVWAEVPTVWRDGRAVLAPPPAGHACSGR